MALIDAVLPASAAAGLDTSPPLDAAVDAAVARVRSPDAARPAVLALLREALEASRAAARDTLERDGDGVGCAAALCRGVDAVVAGAHRYAAGHLYRADNPTSGERIALVATGGYGRGLLAPGSDVDLLFLLPSKQTAWGESVVEGVLYLLWDLKLKVGHATRSAEECVREARADMTIRTALLEARFLLGDEALFERFGAAFAREVVAGTAPEFARAKLEERQTRLKRAGFSRYLVEPNVKEGRGGLRDLATVLWIAGYATGARSPEGLAAAGVLEPEEARAFRACEAFLWRVRCHLHFLTGRAEERLSFDLQRGVAARLGYEARGGLSGVERFMKRYFLTARDVGRLTAVVRAAFEPPREPEAAGLLARFLRRMRRERVAEAPGFTLRDGRFDFADPGDPARDPVAMLRLYDRADRLGIGVHPRATRLVARSLGLVGEAMRADRHANRIFLDLLTSRADPERALRRMNESGLLGRFVPAFGRVVGMMQFNMYHHYTVDEHLVRSVGVLAEIEAGRRGAEHPLANEIMPTLSHRRALYVGMFLHDVAKGRPEDHSLAGARITRRLGPRFGLDEAETETAAWLVEHHLLMSTVAQSRDLSDPRTIEAFAAVVQTLERLKLLLVLTIADITAVGPGVWTGWKGELLRTLYYETEIALAGEGREADRGRRVARAQGALGERLAAEGWPAEEISTLTARHYPAYWLRVPLEGQLRHAALLRRAATGGPFAVEVGTDAFRGVTTLDVLAPDHPRLLATLAGACAAAGANIVEASISTTVDGLALDTLALSRAFERDEDELRRAGRVAATVERALKGEVRMAEVAARAKGGGAKGFEIAPEVIVDNAISTRHTVIEASGLDRPGLLHDLTVALGELSLDIASARVATFGEKAVDVFYVADLTGAKITNPDRRTAVRRRLLAAFAGPDRG